MSVLWVKSYGADNYLLFHVFIFDSEKKREQPVIKYIIKNCMIKKINGDF